MFCYQKSSDLQLTPISSADNIRRYQWAAEKPDNNDGKNCTVQKETDGAFTQNFAGNRDHLNKTPWTLSSATSILRGKKNLLHLVQASAESYPDFSYQVFI